MCGPWRAGSSRGSATSTPPSPGTELSRTRMTAGPETLPDFAESVLAIVDQIPSGMVLAYADVAELLGQGGPRQVGSVMSRYGSSVTWWRVIRASGEAPQELQDEALAHWRAAGTAMVGGGPAGRRVDMTGARWDGTTGCG